MVVELEAPAQLEPDLDGPATYDDFAHFLDNHTEPLELDDDVELEVDPSGTDAFSK